MELKSSEKRELVKSILLQIKKAISDIQEWNKDVASSDDYWKDLNGKQHLAATCMLLEAIGEGFKKVDALTQQQLLIEKDSIPWKEIIGMRNHIAHGYFDIDAELIFDTVKNDLSPLSDAVDYFLEKYQ